MSSIQNIAKCDCCGEEVAKGAGYIINASLSEKFADKIVRAEEKRGTLMKLAPKLVELRMKQVLTCSPECTSRIVDTDEEMELAQRAAELWWQVRNPTAELNSAEDVFITSDMLLRAETEVAVKPTQADIVQTSIEEDGQADVIDSVPNPLQRSEAQSAFVTSNDSPQFDEPIQQTSSGFIGTASRFFATTTGIAIAGGSAVLLLLVALLFIPFGDSGQPADKSGKNNTDGSNENVVRVDAGDVSLPQATTGTCRVYSSEPGFHVIVDGFPVRDANRELVQTPCAVTIARGTHTITVTKVGYYDSTRNVAVGDDSEVVFDVTKDENGQAKRIVDAPYYNAKPGEPIELATLNTAGAEIDPFVTSDGRSIWFAGDRGEGKGIYYATRSTIYEPFEEPQFLEMTRRGFDMPGTPSITGDGLAVIYAIPAKARIFSTTRPNPLADFEPKTPLKFSQRSPTPQWLSAQILADGLRLYWAEDNGEEIRTLLLVRKSNDVDFPDSKTLKVDLPGLHPCLSADGLRQYIFDGQTLRRAIRSKPTQKFSKPETVTEIDLPNFKYSERHRQFFVSDDEQWLYYCDDPVTGGDLFMVRISDGTNSKIALRGKSIPERVIVADNTPGDSKKNMSTGQNRPVDPRSLPLPYTSHWEQFMTLLAERQYEKAKTLIDQSMDDPRLKDDRQLLRWDRDELNNIAAFWKKIKQTVDDLKPGDLVQFGNAQASFVSFEDGLLIAKIKEQAVEKKLDELDADDLLKLADKVIDKTDQPGQLLIGTFLYYDATADPLKAEDRLERAGGLGQQLIEQQGRRKLQQAQQELKRDKFSEAIGFIDFIRIVAPNSGIDREARQLRESLYEYIKWQPIGSRKWETANGEYAAEYGQLANSALLAPKKYKNFELTMEWKTTAENGAGGVIFRYAGQGDLDGITNQYKIYLANDFNVNPDPFSTGAMFRRKAPTENTVKQQGEWNTFKMRVTQGGVRVEVTINNKLVLKATAPDPNIPFEGYVALDGGIGGITYRKMLINELPEERADGE